MKLWGGAPRKGPLFSKESGCWMGRVQPGLGEEAGDYSPGPGAQMGETRIRTPGTDQVRPGHKAPPGTCATEQQSRHALEPRKEQKAVASSLLEIKGLGQGRPWGGGGYGTLKKGGRVGGGFQSSRSCFKGEIFPPVLSNPRICSGLPGIREVRESAGGKSSLCGSCPRCVAKRMLPTTLYAFSQ